MPDLLTVESCVDKVAATMSRTAGRRDLDMVAADMSSHPRAYGAWPGPNWDLSFLRSELCQRLWNTPVHPSEIPPALAGLPFRTLRQLLVYNCTALQLADYKLEDEATAEEWLRSIACNRRCRGTEWRLWLNDPFTWRYRHLSVSAQERIREWTE